MTKPRLRFDKVALALVDRVRAAVSQDVPEHSVLIFTITAPIIKATKTANELVAVLREKINAGVAGPELRLILNGNTIRVRLVKTTSAGHRVLGYVHNPGDTDAIFEDALRETAAARNFPSQGNTRNP